MFENVSLFAAIDPVAGVQPNRDEVEREKETRPAQALFGAPLDEVAISPQAERAAELRRIADMAIATAERPQDIRLLDKPLPELILGHRNRMAEVEKHLGALMERLDIAPATAVAIRGRGDGSFTVEGTQNGDGLARLQAAIADDTTTLSALAEARSSATLSRISAAMGQAMQAAQANARQAETYYGWLRSAAQDSLAMDFGFALEGGRLRGDFLAADGRRLAPYEDLRAPA